MASSFQPKLEMIKLATKYQQNFYELLPDWFEYDSSDHLYMKQNIGFALFGPIEINQQDSTICNTSLLDFYQDTNLFSRITYSKESCKVIKKIYDQIIKFGSDSLSNSIYVGVIYNVILKTIKESNNDSDKGCNEISLMPVFKIKKLDRIWFIDNDGRVYENWQDYLQNNKLPKCTMVYPKDGIYQCNSNYKITKQSSNVWVEVKDSPACSVKNKVFNICDNVSDVLTIGATIGLGVTSFLTPVGPALAAAGFVTGAVSGTWNVTRKSYQLIDRKKHKEAISPVDKNAFPAWFEITSTALTLGTTGGAVLLSRAITKGKSISNVAKIVYNSLTIGNLTVKGVNVVYQGYDLIGKRTEGEKVDISDIFILLSHVLFFSNIVLNAKLAEDLLGSSKGTILERFKNKLRLNRRIKEFNSQNVQNKNESIIYRVKRMISKEDFLSNLYKINKHIKFENGKIKINNITLLDPLVVAHHLLTVGGTIVIDKMQGHSSMNDNTTDVVIKLKNLLAQLLTNAFEDKQSAVNVNLPDISYFDNILSEMKGMTNATDILIKIFNISRIVIQHCNEPQQFLVEAIYFIWEYSKANLKKYSTDACSSKGNSNIYSTLTKIITVLYDVIDTTASELFEAFYTYMLNTDL
ncbi:uncharacterized protein LOC143178711 [Calliopsis andreniformis]|uniref:uncharacterized protein LOC143178711 n=1 Tax=Calliopsis andreniformis TaxID=337506 RepID=UPI003FCEB135